MVTVSVADDNERLRQENKALKTLWQEEKAKAERLEEELARQVFAESEQIENLSQKLAGATARVQELEAENKALRKDNLDLVNSLEGEGYRLERAYAHVRELETALSIAIAHILELRVAWEAGAIREIDNMGGIRSNRNVDVEVKLRAALKGGDADDEG